MDVKLGSERALGYRALVFVFALLMALLAYLIVSRAPDSVPELAAGDVLTRLGARPARPDVVVVALDNAGVAQYGPIKSWPRSVLAQALRRVEDAGAKVVVVDLALDGRQGRDDAALWETMADHRNVVLGMAYDAQRPATYTPGDIRALVFLERAAIADNLTLSPRTMQFAYPLFEPPVSDFTQAAAGVGVFDRETDFDGVLRDARLFYRSTVTYPPANRKLSGRFPQSRLADGAPVALPNLALAAALRIFNLDKSSVHIVSGDTVELAGALSPPVQVPVDAQGRMWIRYLGPTGAPTTYGLSDLLSGKAKPDLHNKIVLLGATASNDPATDLCVTPLGRLPRVDVTASAISTLMDRSYVEVVNRSPRRLIGVLLLVGLATGLCLMWVSGGRALAVALALLVLYLGICYGAFVSGHLLLPILPGLLLILLTYLFALALSVGPFRPVIARASPTYVPPPPGAVRD